jgi:hypothetical protein
VDFGRAASMRRFVEDAAAGSGSDDEPDSKGQDHYDLEDAFFDNSEDVSDEEDMHAHYDAQHLQLQLAPPDGGGSSEDESAPPDGGEENGVVDVDFTTKRRRTEPLPSAPVRVSVRAKRLNPKFLFSQQQRVDAGAVQCVRVCVCVCVCVCVLLSVSVSRKVNKLQGAAPAIRPALSPLSELVKDLVDRNQLPNSNIA